jgi:hypothetical protein
MLINLRSGVIDAAIPDAIGFAVDIADHVENSTGVAVGVWQALYGRPLGSVAWSVVVESFADLATMNQKLAEDADYLDKTNAARQMFIPGSFEDGLTNIVHTAGDVGPMAYVSSLSALGIAGKMPEVMAFGIDIADHVSSVTGSNVSFCTDVFAEVGRVTWIAGYADAAAIDTAQEALATDAGYLERTSRIGDLFVPSSGSTTLSQRLN